MRARVCVCAFPFTNLDNLLTQIFYQWSAVTEPEDLSEKSERKKTAALRAGQRIRGVLRSREEQRTVGL